MEGYSGNPTSFIDIDDRRISCIQRKYEEECARRVHDGLPLVVGLIQRGVMMPTSGMVAKIVEKLKRIANG